MNFIEHLPIIAFSSMISGLYYPLITLILVWITLLGRIAYCVGYHYETKARVPGAGVVIIGEFVLIILATLAAIGALTHE